MDPKAFRALCEANCNKTRNIRTCTTTDFSSVTRVPTEIARKIGPLVALLQDKIDHNHLCKKEEEFLLIYNFQPLCLVTNPQYYTLEMLIKPISKIKDLSLFNEATPLHLLVNGHTGEVINGSQFLIELDELQEDPRSEPPQKYGTYNEYKALDRNSPKETARTLSSQQHVLNCLNKTTPHPSFTSPSPLQISISNPSLKPKEAADDTQNLNLKGSSNPSTPKCGCGLIDAMKACLFATFNKPKYDISGNSVGKGYPLSGITSSSAKG